MAATTKKNVSGRNWKEAPVCKSSVRVFNIHHRRDTFTERKTKQQAAKVCRMRE